MARHSDKRRRTAGFRTSDSSLQSARNRLIMLTGLLLLVLVMMRQASQPASWTWLYKMGDSTGVQGSGNQSRPISDQPGASANQLDHFRSPAGDELIRLPTSEQNNQVHDFPASRPEIDPQRLTAVRDDTYFRPAERDAWFHLIGFLQDTPQSELEGASLGQVSFLQLNWQMEAYRGKLLDVRGKVGRSLKLAAPDNDLGIDEYWQLWVFEKNGSSTPFVAYVLELPPGFPVAEQVEEDVELTGIAFKRWSYPAAEGLMVAPVLLAKQIRWSPTATAPGNNIGTSDDVFWTIILAVAVAMVIVRWVLIWSPRLRHRPARRNRTAEETEKVNLEFLEREKGKDDS